MPEPLLLTVAQVAARMHCSRRTVLNHIGSGDLRAVQPGKRWLVDELDLQHFLDEAQNRPRRRRRQRNAA